MALCLDLQVSTNYVYRPKYIHNRGAKFMCFMVLYRVLTPQGCVDQGEVDHIKDVGNSYSGVTSSQRFREQG